MLQFWQELRSHKNFKHTGSTHMNIGEEPDDNVNALYRRDKAVSCSTGLELSPRPKTCLGVGTAPLPAESVPPPRPRDVKQRGKLDKAHSTPAYDLGADGADGGSLVTQIIPESPTTPTESPTIFVHSAEKADQILDFKKSSSQIGEAILHQQQKRMVTTDIHKTKFTFSEMTEIGDARKHLEVDTDAEGDVENNDLLETVNIGLLEKRTNIDKPISKENSTLSIMSVTSGKGHTDDETSFEHENSVVDRSNIVEAINEQRTVVSVRTPKWRKPLVSQTESPTSPPEPPPRPVITKASHGPSPAVKEYPPLKPVSQLESLDVNELSPLKPPRLGDQLQISVPLKHITKHDIHVIPNSEASPRRELLVPLNHESTGLLEIPRLGAARSHPHLGGAELSGARVQPATSPSTSVSPTASVVRGIFPSSKSKSLKKKNSILARYRCGNSAVGRGRGLVLQRVRVRQRAPGTAPVAPATPPLGDSPAGVWVRRWYVLRDNTLYGFRALDCEKADCLIFLKGFTASPAPEVKSKPFAFKVYHTGTVFYFAAETLEAMTAWLDHISRATMLCYDSWERAHKDKKVDESKHFSETDYSEGDLSDKETTEKKSEGKEKDKSKFGSLKKLTHRIHKSESQESVSSAAASLDRKYLRFFSRSKSKSKTSTPVPTEHYRSYRRVTAAGGELTRDAAAARVQLPAPAPVLDVPLVDNEPTRTQKKLPKPINYIHASNPNLLDFEKSDFVAKPNLNVPLPKAKVHKPDNFMGFVTLQEFMLKKQEEERREMYSNRVLMGVERDARTSSKRAAKELQRQWERIVPDVIYGELRSTDDDRPAPDYLRGRTLPEAPRSAPGAASAPVFARPSDGTKPVSVKDKDGYEKIVYVSDTDAICTPDYDPPQVLPRKLSKAEEDVVESRQRRHSETSDPKAGAEGSSEVRDELKRTVAPQPPPKIMPKSRHVLNRQSSLGSGVVSGGTEGLAVAQGDSPERFWRSSLRRNDRVHSRPPEARAEPKPLKSAAQYTPLSLPAPPATLATAPHLHIALDTGEVVSTASPGVSRLRQVFQGGANPEAPQPVWAGRGVQYPHLQCPPTFEPETYSLADCATSHQRHKHHA
ncbi:Connector enhancer of kinase suppressor of ras 2 [Eumeta japonica]|uniref:Connector enhancer of kinase suppressor of ras 2 n=1 Tax=Eumeta variegata TaxID=151549 RepID=A0A4C1ZYB6_EUMVA|nr:Connector enhancer of kinase suppressor of ras 2 [Eumeta japonica]